MVLQSSWRWSPSSSESVEGVRERELGSVNFGGKMEQLYMELAKSDEVEFEEGVLVLLVSIYGFGLLCFLACLLTCFALTSVAPSKQLEGITEYIRQGRVGWLVQIERG